MSPEIAVRNSFEYLGVTAVFDPSGDAHLVRLIPTKGEEVGFYEGVKASVGGTLYEIMASDWDLVKDASNFVIDGISREVQGTPKAKDARRLVLVLDSYKT